MAYVAIIIFYILIAYFILVYPKSRLCTTVIKGAQKKSKVSVGEYISSSIPFYNLGVLDQQLYGSMRISSKLHIIIGICFVLGILLREVFFGALMVNIVLNIWMVLCLILWYVTEVKLLWEAGTLFAAGIPTRVFTILLPALAAYFLAGSAAATFYNQDKEHKGDLEGGRDLNSKIHGR